MRKWCVLSSLHGKGERERHCPSSPPMMCPLCQVLALCSLPLPGRETESISSIWRWCSTPRRPVSEGQLQRSAPPHTQIHLPSASPRPPETRSRSSPVACANSVLVPWNTKKQKKHKRLCWGTLQSTSQTFGECWNKTAERTSQCPWPPSPFWLLSLLASNPSLMSG